MDRGNGAGPPGGPSRAERFEDEKRRIIETCFNKKDPDGSLQETYITHIRIVEFSSHPASPPPANARAPESEKPRVIIIAVRKSGRVRMHKSKENPNGTYSIGKTWNLDDLTRIESYTAPSVSWEHRESAGETGFLVSLGKPYFWQAQSDKEKKFFIASMIKIYGKYTSGKVPELVGFDQKELDQVLGAGKRYPPPPQRQQSNQSWSASSVATAAPPPSLQRQQSNQTFASSAATIVPDASSPVPAALTPGQPPGQPPSQGQARSRSRSRGPSPGRGPPPSLTGEPPSRPQQWTPPIRNPAGGDGSPAGSIDSTTSRERPGIRHANPNSRSQESVARSFATTRSEDVPSIPPRSRNGMQGPGTPGRFGDPSEPPTQPLPTPPQPGQGPSQPRSQSSLAGSRPRTPREEQPSAPERRRPPMDPTRPQDRDLVPPPLSAKRDIAGRESPARDTPPRASTPKDPMAPPPRSSERMSPRKDSLSYRPGTATSLASTIQDRSTPPPSFSPTPKAESPRPREPVASPPAPVTSPEPEEANTIKSEASAPSTPMSEPMSPPEPPPVPEEEARPGLGPMIKAQRSKGEIAGAFRKAASAAAMANAFKPRPGGAGERLRQAAQQMQNKTSDEPDGITGVVPAPPKPVVETPKSITEREATPEPVPPPRAPQRTSKVPEVKVSVPTSNSRPPSQQAPVKEQTKEAVAVQELEPPKPPPRKSLVARQDAKYLQSLGIDPTVLDGRSEEFGTWLDHFGWIPGQQMQSCNMEAMQFDLDREINKAQAGGWLARFQEEDDRVDAIKLGIDVAISECEELDNLLTLYSVELSTLSEDIAYIEAQGQGLQVQTANQKLLKKELESLLETCAITSTNLDPLRLAPIDHLRGLEDVEQALVTLYRAMAKMDGAHSLKASPTTAPDGSGLKSDFGDMRIVQEKKEMYIQESSSFIRRLLEFMPQQYDQAFAETKRAMEGALSKKADVAHHDAGRDMLWRYNPLMLYTRFAERGSWDALVAMYQEKGAPIYKNEFLTVIMSWKKNARKVTGGEAELLFTSQSERQQENVATAARKATVKRSQTLARAWRSPLADGSSKGERDKAANDGRSFPYEVFAGVLDDLLPLVEMEQNFIIDFFHATTLEQSDFPDCVAAVKPRDRRGGDLRRHRLMEPDRDLAKRVTRAMDVMFAFLDSEFTRLMEWVIGQDPMQAIGVIVTVEKKQAEISQSNQDFLNTIFQKLHGLLKGRLRKFVDDQVRAIEDTKVKIKKRKGVISFIRVFPHFSTAVENMLTGVDTTLPIRKTIDNEYDRMLKSMFDSLKVIARENPAVGVSTGGADPEDKEALNFHILLIENMNHFLEETDTRGLETLETWKTNAETEYHDHMDLYLAAVMRRPLGKLLDHLENIEAQLQSGKAPVAIAAQPSNSKSIFNKVLGQYDAKEVRKGIEALRKRVDKHFGDADDPALSRDLVAKVLRECERFYGDVESRLGRIVTDIYGGDVLFEWPRAEVKAAFR